MIEFLLFIVWYFGGAYIYSGIPDNMLNMWLVLLCGPYVWIVYFLMIINMAD